MTATDLTGETADETVLQRLNRWAETRPNHTALIYLVNGETAQEPVTFASLQRSARAVADALLQADATGKRALLLYQPGLEFVTGFLGCLYAGVIAIPVYAPKTNRNQLRLTGIIHDSGATFALSTRHELQRWTDNNLDAENLASLCWIATDGLTADGGHKELPAIGPDNIALLQYSSGSTGAPKGVMVSHGNLVHNLEYSRRVYKYEEGCVSLSWLPIFHDMGLVLGLLQPLYAGITCVLMPPAAFTQKPLRWLQAITAYKATHSSAPNFAFDLCCRRITPEEREALDLSSWQMIVNGAEPVRKATLDEFSRMFESAGFKPQVFCPAYGLAEATLIVTGEPMDRDPTAIDVSAAQLEQHRAVAPSNDEATYTIVACGPTGTDMDFKIVDPATGRALPDGEVGEIWASSPSVCKGYWNKPLETAQTFRALIAGSTGPYYLRTGDLGFAIDGVLYVTGRMKDLIIVRGRNLYPQDIEFTTEKCAASLRSGFGAAFSITVQGVEQLVIAYELERVAIRTTDRERIIDDVCRGILDEFEVRVHDVVLLQTGSIPKTTSGKIQRAACRAAYVGGTLDVIASHIRLASTLRKSVLHKPDELTIRTVSIVGTFIWQIFGRQEFVTPDSRIRADLGLDSLDVTVLVGKVEKDLGITIDLSTAQAFDTVNDLIAIIRRVQKPPFQSHESNGVEHQVAAPNVVGPNRNMFISTRYKAGSVR
jgi:acyl carrier protein